MSLGKNPPSRDKYEQGKKHVTKSREIRSHNIGGVGVICLTTNPSLLLSMLQLPLLDMDLHIH